MQWSENEHLITEGIDSLACTNSTKNIIQAESRNSENIHMVTRILIPEDQSVARKNKVKYSILLYSTILVALFFSFWRLGDQPLYDWDEARHGQNAIEMLQNGDYVNYFYNGQHDTWNAKPPLYIWAVVASYKLFGFSEFALRFPSALAAAVTILVCVTLSLRMTHTLGAWLTLLILVSSRGIFGFHTGRTGDMDAFLVCFGLSAVLCWQVFIEEGRRIFVYLAPLLWGLAFLSKGLAALLFIPGAVAIAFLNSRNLTTAISLKATALASFFPLCWALVVKKWGLVSSTAMLDGRSGTSLDVMLFYDVWTRLTQNIEGHGNSSSFAYIFKQWDVYFSPWIYLFYAFILIWLIRRNSPTLTSNQSDQCKKVTLWVCLYIAPLCLLLTVARSKLPWYIAPTVPFLALLLTTFIVNLSYRNRVFIGIISLIFVFALGRQIRTYASPRNIPDLNLIDQRKVEISESPCVKTNRAPSQAERLKLNWIQPGIEVIEPGNPQLCNVELNFEASDNRN